MLYIYLIKKNKTTMKIISKSNYDLVVAPNRLNNLNILNLNSIDKTVVEGVLKEHQMEWECWIETAENDIQLKEKLKSRGCSVPSSHQIIHKLTSTIPQNLMHNIDKKIMTRRV